MDNNDKTAFKKDLSALLLKYSVRIEAVSEHENYYETWVDVVAVDAPEPWHDEYSPIFTDMSTITAKTVLTEENPNV